MRLVRPWPGRGATRRPNGLDDAPIRWLVDDARAFVARERRRGSRYDGIVLDPPTYGHGASGRPWRLDTDLDPLLADCRAILAPDGFLLLTAHTEHLGEDQLAGRLGLALRRAAGDDRDRRPAPRRDVGREPGARCLRALGRRKMTTMSEPALASPSNPRIKAAARLRERRERDASGLTLVDGARELRRALEAGVEVVEAFVCEPLRRRRGRPGRPRRAPVAATWP